MSTNSTAKSSESALVVDVGRVQDVQAQFTRLEMALGLKESMKPEGTVPHYVAPRIFANLLSRS
jgi:hypothetical protein